MSLLSASVSITRYKVEGKLKTPVTETVAAALKKNTIFTDLILYMQPIWFLR